MLWSMILAALLAGEREDGLRVRLREPSWTEGAMSVNGRLLMLAEILSADSLDDAWLEVQTGPEEEWQRQPIPPSHRLRLSAGRTVVATALEPRRLPDVRAGDTLRVRIVATGPGRRGQSSILDVCLKDPDERQALLLSRLERVHQDLQALLSRFEAEHQLLSRIERASRDADVLGVGMAAELQALEPERAARPEELLGLGRDVLVALDEGSTDRLIQPDRWRRMIVDVLRGVDDTDSPFTLLRETLARARRAKTPGDRRAALRSALQASHRLMFQLRRALCELDVGMASLEIRQLLRSVLQDQREITGDLQH